MYMDPDYVRWIVFVCRFSYFKTANGNWIELSVYSPYFFDAYISVRNIT